MSAATEVTHAALLKRIYPEDKVEKLMYDNNPLFAMMPKGYEFFGESEHRAIRYAHTVGRSADFGTAKANKQGSSVTKMLVTTVTDFSLYSVGGRLIRASSSAKGALVNALTEEVDAAMDAMNRSFGWGVYNNGGGALGKIASGTTGATVTLDTIDDIVRFEVGQWLQASSTDGTSGSVRAGRVQVTALDRDAGTITVSGNWNAAGNIPLIGATDYLFADGDFGARMSGLKAWIPTTAPGATSFFGLDRSVDVVRLGGARIPGTNLSIVEAVKKGLQVGYRNGAKTSHIFMNDKNFLDLDLELQSQKRYVDTKVAGVGFTGIEFVGHGGKPVEIYPDSNCPLNTSWGLQMDTWSIEGPGKFPFIDATDGNKMLREESADAFEGRIKSYHQMICKAPGRNWVVSL
jgi:hypothetical protein